MIISWRDNNIDGDLLGGKGKNLAWLCNHGIPVPPWICITTKAFKEYTEPLREKLEFIFNSLDYDDPVALKRGSERIADLFESYPFPSSVFEVLEKQLSGEEKKLFAVRSSGNREDSAECSFAGLFETYLFVDVEEIPKYVKSCWLSLFNPGALGYLFKRGINPLDVEVAVVVQEMIHSEKSGVLFQADPVGKLEELVFVAGHGLGEGIVSDLVETDTYYHDKITGKRRAILNQKKSAIRLDPEKGKGVKKLPLPENLWNERVLGDQELDRLVELHHSIAKLYDEYQDIEWAICDKGNTYIMQSRPITTIPAGPLNLYDYTNIIENYPGANSPLTCEFVKEFFYKTHFTNALRGAGYSDAVLNENRHHFAGMVEPVQGRLYYNLSHWYKILSLFPTGTGNLDNYLDEMLGVSSERERNDKKSKNSFFNNAKVLTKLSYLFLNWKSYFNGINELCFRICEESRTATQSENENTELKKIVEKTTKRLFFDKRIGLIQVNDFFLMVCMGVLKKLIHRLDPESADSDSLLNGLLVGEEGMESVEPVLSIMKMVAMVRQSSDLLKALKENALSALSQKNTNDFKEFKKQFEKHLKLYGDRGISELKMETVTFYHKPENLLKLVLNHVDSNIDTDSMGQREAALRNDAEKRLAQVRKKQRWTGKFTKYMLEKVRLMLKNRESARLNRARIVGVYREIFRKIEANWIREGLLEAEGDILCLNHREILDHIPNCDPALLKKQVDQGKKEWEQNRSADPAPRMWLKGSVKENFIPQIPKIDKAQPQSEISGMGCCPGVITGEAVVLHAPDETVDVKNKIIIAENTDPGWVFLIMAAKGIIIEKGSLLSHTAIIGRELGIPTIVGVHNGTEKIPTGSTIEMNGGDGSIKILS